MKAKSLFSPLKSFPSRPINETKRAVRPSRAANASPDPLRFVTDFRDEMHAVVSGVRIGGGEEETALLAINQTTVAAMNMGRGVTHAEYIRAEEDGRYYFLEIASRVGGAGIDRLIEHAAGFNPWVEWARIEVANLRGEPYHPPTHRRDYAGLIVSLARQEWPDTSAYNDPEVKWRLSKTHHVGFVVAGPDYGRVQGLVGSYIDRIAVDYTASQPPMDKAPS